jgi:hypothetical protein
LKGNKSPRCHIQLWIWFFVAARAIKQHSKIKKISERLEIFKNLMSFNVAKQCRAFRDSVFNPTSSIGAHMLTSAKKKNYFIVARIWRRAARVANDETTPNSTLASITSRWPIPCCQRVKPCNGRNKRALAKIQPAALTGAQARVSSPSPQTSAGFIFFACLY